MDRSHFEALDRADPLARFRDRFRLPQGIIYLDGNSLGAMPESVLPRMDRAIRQEWAEGLIRSWNDAGWYTAAQRVSDRIAQLIGAAPGQVIVADSISVNLFKLLMGACHLQQRRDPGRTVLIGETDNFPTDAYLVDSVARLVGFEPVRVAQDEVPAAIAAAGERLAVVQLTHVHYRSGERYDMAQITRQVQACGGLVIWDLAHSAGAMPVELDACGVDFAVGCTYKYLNGGPGAPAFAYVARRWIEAFEQPLVGWHGHARPFDFKPDFVPAPGIERLLCGTQAQLSLIALEAALEAFDGVDLGELRKKSLALGDAFISLVESQLAPNTFRLESPRDNARRGSQVSFAHPQGYAIMQALIARGVIGDFRAPDVLRFGFTPLYVRYVDLWDAVATLAEVVRTEAWNRPEYLAKKAVT